MSEIEHSKGYNKSKKYYPRNWSAAMLVALVERAKLYNLEYNEITGFVYPAISN